VFKVHTDAQRIQCSQKHKNLIANRFSRSKVIQNAIEYVGEFSQGAGTSGTQSDIAFSQLAVKGLMSFYLYYSSSNSVNSL
jgi:hypothetical protein